MIRRRTSVAFVGLLLLSAACSSSKSSGGVSGPADEIIGALPDAAIDSTSAAVSFATAASAPNAFGIGMAPALFATAGIDPACPIVSGPQGNQTITGGCTDTSGNTYDGTIDAKNSDFRYNTWKISYNDTCGGIGFTSVTTFEGSVHLTGAPTTGVAFAENVTGHGTGLAMTTGTNCAATDVTFAVVYSGSMANTGPDADMDGTPDISVWQGSGEVGIQGVGAVSASTTDENINQNACNSEALSGSTTVTSGTHTAIFTYDGATDCSADSTVTWTYDGVARGTLQGVSCDVGVAGGTAGTAFGGCGLLVALLATRAGRRKREHQR